MPAVMPTGPDFDDLLNTLVLDATALDDDHLRLIWDTELPDLPHPYLEDPEQLFRYDVDDRNQEIWIKSVGGERADRALSAVEAFLGLNREELRRQRYSDYRIFALLRATTLTSLDASLRKQVINELRIQQGRTQPFAGMKRYFAKIWALPGPH